jgi:tetratricopeptide (TPR) repeat protein
VTLISLAAGRQHHQAGRLAEAEACFRRVLAAQPDHADAYSNLGAALWAQGKLDEAVAAYRHAIRIKPDLAEAHSNLYNALRGQGKLEEALASCDWALSGDDSPWCKVIQAATDRELGGRHCSVNERTSVCEPLRYLSTKSADRASK